MVLGFWLKKVSSLHKRASLQLQYSSDGGFMPSWMTNKRPVLLQKCWSKGKILSNFESIFFTICVKVKN